MYIETKSMVGGRCRTAIHHLSVWLEVFGWMIGWDRMELDGQMMDGKQRSVKVGSTYKLYTLVSTRSMQTFLRYRVLGLCQSSV